MITAQETPFPDHLTCDLDPWEHRLVSRNSRGARVAVWLVLFLYPTFGILDYIMAPSSALPWLFSSRGLVIVCSLLMLGLLKTPFFALRSHALTASYMFLVALGICVMVGFMGGLASPYYAGLNLVMIGCGLLYVWPPTVCMVTHGAICLSWLIPNLFFTEGFDPIIATSNALFLFATACIVTAGQIFNFKRLRVQHDTQRALEDTKSDLEVAHEQLKQLDSFKNRFFANITHELKTPLALILSSLELMLRGDFGYTLNDQKQPINQMQRSGAKLLKLINDLLDLSKLEESRLRLKVREQEVVAWTRSLVDEVKPLAERKGVTMHFLAEKEDLKLWCDLERMERILINLLSNATKFTNAGGSVQVRLMDLGSKVRFEVQDSGRGFSPEDAEKIFQRFYQTDMGATRQFGGTGIGLALAQELVELHQGRIWAQGEEGVGATFFIELLKGSDHFEDSLIEYDTEEENSVAVNQDVTQTVAIPMGDDLRLIDMREASERRVVERDQDEEAREATVLIAEDNPDIIRLLHLSLKKHFKVVTAPHGLKAWELIERFKPDLVITDQMMPEMDGIELTEKIKSTSEYEHIPVVMLSARDGIQEEMRLRGCSADAYMSKPFSTRKLTRLASSLIKGNAHQAA